MRTLAIMKRGVIYRSFRFLRSFYFIAGVSFIVWITFFDNNNLINQYHLSKKLSSLKAEKQFYHEEIERLENDMEELSSDPELLEKFVREKYMFQRKGEDIYIVEETE